MPPHEPPLVKPSPAPREQQQQQQQQPHSALHHHRLLHPQSAAAERAPSSAVAAVRSKHPRRPPAHQSVSLMHSPPRKHRAIVPIPRQQDALPSANTSVAPQSDRANPPSSSSSMRPKNQQHSSGESSDAGKWFESSNNNVGESNTAFVDNDPPFFLRNSSSSSTPPDAVPDAAIPFSQYPQSAAIPFRPGMLTQANDGSSTDDYRSVIDDLTIANKRLKKKLRKYEKLYDAHLQSEKLFEVRVHGLPPQKRKELEDTLKQFAMSIDTTPSTESIGHSYDRMVPQLDARNTATSSHTSRIAESGYASMSASGQHSSALSATNDPTIRRAMKLIHAGRRSDIQSYLQDIPPGLLPKHTTAMTEKSKKKLVVRRLEQIFAGKGAAGAHHQPLQQQEVAQSAAAADRRAVEESGQLVRKEGMREARIMPAHEKHPPVDLNTVEASTKTIAAPRVSVPAKPAALTKASISSGEHDVSSTHSPDQRPTRPLDLDPHRAQVPSDNMDYIRHLGFSPPDPESTSSPEEGHGWIYLNLLVNMAQLHTINVTTDFVKDAIKDYSDKLELSHDGRKIRWKGGHDVTYHGSDSSSNPNSSVTPDDAAESAEKKRASKKKRSESDESSANKKARRLGRPDKNKSNDKLTYTPLFFHKEDSEAEGSSGLGPSSISSPVPARGSSAFASSGDQTNSSRRRGDDGPIIFYNKANFCTDLSGDIRGTESSRMDPSKYHKSVVFPVGSPNAAAEPARMISKQEEKRGPLATEQTDDDEMDISDDTSSGNELRFSPSALEMNAVSGESPENYNFEVSGLGGVEPRDNFAIYVVYRQSLVPNEAAEPQTGRRQSVTYPSKLRSIIQNAQSSSPGKSPAATNATPAVSGEIISTTHRSLPASVLPPASFLPFHSSSSDPDSDLESSASEASFVPSVLSQQHPIARQHLNILSDAEGSDTEDSEDDSGQMDEDGDHNEDDANDDDDDNEDDEMSIEGSSGSVDFLATARRLDPQMVHAREREYDASMADRLADEIPAGSSAATAGGGSGFCSPASHLLPAVGSDKDDGRPDSAGRKVSGSSGPGLSRGPSLKRTRTNDSLVVHGKAPKLD